MRRVLARLACFTLAGIISFLATIAPAYALTASFAGLPSINAIIQGTIGTFVDSSTGVTITRSAVALAEGVSIPFTVAETATFAEVAAGAVAAGLATPAGFAAAAVAVAAGLYLWHKCVNSPSGWCKDVPGTVSVDKGHYWADGAGVQYAGPSQACAAHGFPNIIMNSNGNGAYCNYSSNGTNDYTGVIATVVAGTCRPGFTPGPNDTCTAPSSTTVAQDTDPVHSPEALSLTQRAMSENKMLASVFAEAAQKDGHPVDDPKVNPQLPTTVTAPTTASVPTTKTETAPDGTKTTTTCTGNVTLGVSNPGNDTATVTKSTSGGCTAVATAPDGTTKTTTTTTSEGPKSASTGPVECGSPGKPKCAIDETGTPESTVATTTGTAISTEVVKSKDAASTVITDASTADHKSATSWQFSFSLPSTCQPFPMFLNIVLDYCRFQPMIHDIMSVVWYGSTFFAIVGMFGRTAREA